MPNTMNKWADELNDGALIKDYYVYGWACEDWGGVYFYVGKGMGTRYKQTSKRSKAFKAILDNWNCFPVILIDGLSESEAFEKENDIKTKFIFERGFPIMDGENSLASMACKVGKDYKRKHDPNYKEGRKPVYYDTELFPVLLRQVNNGEKTVADAARELGISRAKWYRLVKEVA